MNILRSVDDTLAWGRTLSASLKGGDVVALVGNLGAGKTHCAKGIAQGMGCTEAVTSPTFTLVHEYGGGRLPVYHFDFYRLKSAAEALGIGWDDYLVAEGVMVVEWANLFPELFPENARWFRFEVLPDDTRGVTEVTQQEALAS